MVAEVDGVTYCTRWWYGIVKTVRSIVASYINYTINQLNGMLHWSLIGILQDGEEKISKLPKSTEVIFESSTNMKKAQEKLLANKSYKLQLIALLSQSYRI